MLIYKKLPLLVITAIIFCACKTIKTKENKALSLKQEIPLKLENKGVGGNTTVDLLNRLGKDVVSKKPDLVILMVGTNDMLNSKKLVSYDDYQSNLTKIVKAIKNKETEVLLVSPPTADSIYLYERHDKNLFTDTPNVKLQKATQIMEKIASDNNVLFVDNHSAFKAKNLPIHNVDDYIRNEKNSNKKDGVHLKPKGYKFIAKNIFLYLKKNDLLNKYKNIICFGDSLTKGSGANGAGTTTGENYPSFLYTMLTNNSIN